MKVQNLLNDTYLVYVIEDEGRDTEKVVSLFQGSLADCQAFIWLRERAYL